MHAGNTGTYKWFLRKVITSIYKVVDIIIIGKSIKMNELFSSVNLIISNILHRDPVLRTVRN